MGADLKLQMLLSVGFSKSCNTDLLVRFLVVCPPYFLKADVPVDLILDPRLVAEILGHGFCHRETCHLPCGRHMLSEPILNLVLQQSTVLAPV